MPHVEMSSWIWAFVFAVIAALWGWSLVGRSGEDPNTIGGRVLYVVAIACALIGVAMFWLDHS